MSERWSKCWKEAREIHSFLKGSESLEGAREHLMRYLDEMDWRYRREWEEIASWDYILRKEAVRCLRNLISPRHERLAGASCIAHLWKAARDGESEVADDFIEEFEHIFGALHGRAEVYPSLLVRGTEPLTFDAYKGREAALKRSAFLDGMSEVMAGYLARYQVGLAPEIVERRKEHKRRILEILGAGAEDWNDWRWQFRNVFKGREGFERIKRVIRLMPWQEEAIAMAVECGIPFGVTPHYLHLMDPEPTSEDYALRRQVFPPLSYVKRMIEHREDREVALDFMREHDTSPVPLVTRRYPRVAIIKPYDTCPQICVYCQRNWEITSPFMAQAMAPQEQLDAALDWFAEHEHILDVLVTGGDPLTMADERIDYVLRRLTEIKHIRSIRIATRIPITVPQRVTEELCEIFAAYYELGKQTICMVSHFTHPYEVTLDTAEAIKRVKMHGLHVYNQQVFTFANSRRFETAALRIAMKQIGVDPYYTFNMKGKEEIEDYAVPLARILQERKEEARLLPGIFRTDEPVFNVPFLGKNHLRAWQDHELISILPDGRRVYSFHPWEKNIAKVKPYLYTDVTIKSYLDKLRERGDDPDDYRSIWYYY
ncbi:MAG: KamA family radical SAM protein [Candidatus Thermoplasmatota archaeon]